MNILYFSIVWLEFICVSLGNAQDGPIIETGYGPVQGAVGVSTDGLPYEEYLGIPFGAPPTGQERFTKPRPPASWGPEVRDATEFGPHCVHFIALAYPFIGMSNETSEDCLTLNVIVPGESRVGDNLAVMVWVYGGAYLLGTSTMYPAQDLATFGDVIVVTMNYRVGPIGFLSTEDDVALGNYALWDVHAVLEWVQDNIAAFGGDAGRVTVFGQSAGASMTSHVMISPQTQGLFQRGIAISGGSSGFFGAAVPGNVLATTETLARIIGCRRLNGSQELVDCLREVPAGELDFWGFVAATVFNRQLPNYIPVVDGDFVAKRPSDSWAEGAAAEVDMLTGFAFHDAAGFVTANPLGMPFETINFAATNDSLDRTIDFVTSHYPNGQTGKDMMYEQYPLLLDEDVEIRTRASSEATTEWWFGAPSHYEAKEHARTKAEGKKTFHYCFHYDQSFLEYPEEWIQGSHFDDTYSVFGERHMEVMLERFFRGDGKFNDTDRAVMRDVMSYYTNFAKSGNPNEGLDVPVNWPEYDENQQYLEISEVPQVLTETAEKVENYRFWNEDFTDAVLSDPVDEYLYEDILEMDDASITLFLEEVVPQVIETLSAFLPRDEEIQAVLLEKAYEYMDRRLERIENDDWF